jgi:uncharacterized membrane protein
MEAFSDGVIAILITIMVLDLRVPHGAHLSALHPLVPVVLSYALSFVNLGIYWNNHHHLLQVAPRVTAAMLWANLHLLFWLSLFPFATAWMGENHFAKVPVVVYGLVALLAGVAYYILQTVIVASEGQNARLAAVLGRDLKGKASPVLYVVGICLTFVNRWIGFACYVAVALMWLIPDRRLELRLTAVDNDD